MIPTLEEFVEMCKTHDWFYCMSDDYGVWQRGEKASVNLMNLARNGGEDYQRAYNIEYAKQFHREPFVEPYTFPFPETK